MRDGALDWEGTESETIYVYRLFRIVDIPYAFPETFTEAVLTQYLEQLFMGEVFKWTLEVNH